MFLKVKDNESKRETRAVFLTAVSLTLEVLTPQNGQTHNVSVCLTILQGW